MIMFYVFSGYGEYEGNFDAFEEALEFIGDRDDMWISTDESIPTWL